MMPIRCDTAWGQDTKPHATGYLALPPEHADQIGKVNFRIIGLDGSTLGEHPGKLETFESEGNFQRMKAQWPGDLATPGEHHLLGIVYDKNGKELARVAPRMVSVNMVRGIDWTIERGATRHCPRRAAFRPLQRPNGMDETIGLWASER